MLKRVLKVSWFVLTLIIAYGLTIAPKGLVERIEALTGLPFDPQASFRHFLLFSVYSFLSTTLYEWDGLLFSVLLGGGTELVQWFVPWRTFDVGDLLANSLGSLLGAYLTFKLLRGSDGGSH